MPVRSRSYSEVGPSNGEENCLSRAYAQHTRVSSDSDGGSETLSLGKRPTKYRKSDGINIRLSKMLFRVNTSFIADMPTPESKRPRKHSNGSSSSTIGPEIPQTPVESIHASVKSNNVGEGFAIIKVGSSPDKGRSGYLSSKHLPSWRDADKQKEAERNRQRQELPDWLSQTFSILEPSHPLRALASTEKQSPAHSDSHTLAHQDLTVPQEAHLLQKPHDETVFSFEPPQGNFPGAEVDIADQLCADHPPADDTLNHFTGGEAQLDSATSVDDEEVYQNFQINAEEFRPFVQPGPYAQKNVHFLTPTRTSPISLSYSASAPLRNHSIISAANQPQTNNYTSAYTPFATPGPVSHIPSISPIHASDSINNRITSSDSLTIAEDMRTENDVFAHSVYDDNSAISGLSFNSNLVDNNLDLNLFSTPGPTFCAPPVGYFNSPIEDPSLSDPAEQAYDDIELEIEKMLSDEPQADLEQQKAMRFIAREHFEMTNGSRGSGINSSNNTSNVGESAQLEHIGTGASLSLYRLEDHRPLEPEFETNNFTSAEPETDTNSPARIELFSSPPYIRFAQTQSIRNIGSHTARSQPSLAKNNLPPVHSSPYMRLDRLPSPPAPAFNGALPCTPPRSQPPKPMDNMGVGSINESYASANIPASASVKGATLNMKPQPKPRPRARPPGSKPDQNISFSPSNTMNTKRHPAHAHDKDTKTRELASQPKAKVQNDGTMWNDDASQSSEDSIQDWEP